MAEKNVNRLAFPDSEHGKNANDFMKAIKSRVIPQFKDLSIEPSNMTEEDLSHYPDMILNALAENDLELLEELRKDDADTEHLSAHQVAVFVNILGDSDRDIREATHIIHQLAGLYKGRRTGDTGVVESKMGESLSKILGHRPEHEDQKRLQRMLNYLFTS
jgi:hypothetical protein